jgi:RNA polymerase sigma-70 factor (ECF subfamily)
MSRGYPFSELTVAEVESQPLKGIGSLVDYSASSPEEVVRACTQSGDQSAWDEFVRRFQPLIAVIVLRTARRWGETSPQVMDDLIQETYLKLCDDDARLLRMFRPRHPDAVYGYLKVVTANLVHDHFKELSSKKRGGGMKPACEEVLQSESSNSGSQDVERDVLIREIEAALRSLVQGAQGARDRRIFWLYYRVGLPASAIAALPSIGLSTKGVESTLVRLTRTVREKLAGSRTESPRARNDPKGIRASDSLL